MRGRLHSVSIDYKTGDYLVTFSTGERTSVEGMESLKDQDLDITAEKAKKKRSLDSNAYAWVLMQKLAEATHTDKWSVYLEMLKRYSRAFTFVVVKPGAVERFAEEFRTVVDLGEVTINGQTGHQLQVYFGSSTFDSKEMSVFLEGIVSECKELGIETLTPRELAEMSERWGK